MPTLKHVLDILEELAPSSAAEDWDNPGLQVGHLSQDIEKIFISLDPTLKALRKALKRNAQLLLTHHTLVFRPISSLNREVYPGDVIFEALENGICIVAVHTNLDMVLGGINDSLAGLFGLQDVEALEKRSGLGVDGAGLGRIGDLPGPVKLSKMTERVKAILGAEKIRVVGPKNRRIRRVAVVGGAGGGMVSIASKKGADLLVSGDIRHHEALEAKTLGLALIDAGHFHTEKPALRPFAERLKDTFMKRDMDVIVEIYDDEKDAMRYE